MGQDRPEPSNPAEARRLRATTSPVCRCSGVLHLQPRNTSECAIAGLQPSRLRHHGSQTRTRRCDMKTILTALALVTVVASPVLAKSPHRHALSSYGQATY